MAFTDIIRDETGQGLVEYGLILVLIAIVAIGAVALLGTQTNAMFENAQQKIDTAINAG